LEKEIKDLAIDESFKKDFTYLYVLVALVPVTVLGLYRYGLSALLTLVISVGFTMVLDIIMKFIEKKPFVMFDFKAISLGLMLGLVFPANIKWYYILAASAFSVIVLNTLLRGPVKNLINPVIGASCLLLLISEQSVNSLVDIEAGATSLSLLKDGSGLTSNQIFETLLIKSNGAIGEVSSLAILLGAIILLLFNVIDLLVPLSFILSFSTLILIISGYGFNLGYLVTEICGGGLLFAAFFLLADKNYLPQGKINQVIYGIIMGLGVALMRVYGPNSEGLTYIFVIGNILIPAFNLINKVSDKKELSPEYELEDEENNESE